MMKPDFKRGYVADKRLWALLIPAIAALSFDVPVMLTLLYSLTAILVVVALAHFIRRVLMPYIDLEIVVQQATSTGTGAGAVFLGVCIFLSSIVMATAMWIAK